MHLRPVLPILIVLIAAFAGCLGGDDEPEPTDPDEKKDPGAQRGVTFKPAESNDLEKAFEAIEIVEEEDPDWERPNLTKDDWLLLSTPMNAEGGVTAFEWDYPKSAIVTDPRGGGKIIALDFAFPLDEMGASGGLPEGNDWMVLVFYERNDVDEGWQTVLGDYAWAASLQHLQWEGTDEPTSTVEPPASDPFILRVGGGDKVGDKIYIVIAARGSSGGPFGVGVRALSEADAGLDSSPSGDWAGFADQVDADENRPYVPQRVAESDGLYLAWHIEEMRQGEWGAMQRALQDEVEVSHSVPSESEPLVPPRQTELASSVSWGGWSDVAIRYLNTPSNSHWTMEGDINGQDANKQVVFVAQAVRNCAVMTEGSSGSSLTNTILNAATLDRERIEYKHFSVNLEIESISGLPLRSNWNC